jgi:hypothetical protein
MQRDDVLHVRRTDVGEALIKTVNICDVSVNRVPVVYLKEGRQDPIKSTCRIPIIVVAC